jgi:diguanylate cyclase (GGDEF)-like protein
MPESSLATRRQPRDSLATKIIFFVFFSTFVTALVVSWISVHSTYAFLRSHLEVVYPQHAERAAPRLDRMLTRASERLAAQAADPELGRLAADGDPAALAQRLDAILAETRAFAALSVTGADGALRATAAHPGSHLPPRPSGPLGGPSLRAVDGRPVASAPLRDAGGVVRGALHAALAVEPFADALRAAREPNGVPLFLVDDADVVVAAGLPAGAGAFAAFPPELRASAAAVREFRTGAGQRAIGVYAPLSRRGWGVVAAERLEVAFAPVFTVVTRVFVIDLAIILVFSFLAYEITAKIVRPLEALSEGARRISQGELTVEIADTRTHDEIGLLTRTFNDMARRLRRNREEIDRHHGQLREQNEELQRANEVLEQLSITDGLTKLHNHRYFQETLTREIKRVSRSGEPLAMLLVDIDDFKALNDRHGHAEGDAVLERIARVLNECVRESDVLARYGGEEFVVLATGTDLAGGVYLAEKVRTAVAETTFLLHDSLEPMRATVSIGVAAFEGDRKRFFHAADRALYRAKAAGKNCVVAAEPGDAAA